MTTNRTYGLATAAAFIAVSFFGCVHSTLPLTKISAPMPQSPLRMESVMEIFGSYSEGNFSNRSWPGAFDAMHQKLMREYPFTDWKRVDWDALYDTYQPRVEAAEQARDPLAYYLALREYLFSIPDGSISITTPPEYRELFIGGGYGFSLLPLEDGKVIIARIDKDSHAAAAGIQWGAEILEWNGLPIAEALAKTRPLWSDAPAPTREYERFEQCALLTRAPVGTPATFMFRNPGSSDLWITRLEARRDFMRGFEDLTDQGKAFTEFESPLEIKTLPDNVGYIRIYCQAATLAMPFPVRAFRRAVEKFSQSGIHGLILDLRGNTGGLDDLAAAYAGHFTETPLFFRDVVAFDPNKGGFAQQEGQRMMVEPRSPNFTGPLIVLIDRNTHEGGEALAATLNKMPHVTLMGMTATEGAYSLGGGKITMPNGYMINYPTGRMLEESGTILATSGADQNGGVAPTIRIPYTLENCDAIFNQNRDIVLERAVAEITARSAASK